MAKTSKNDDLGANPTVARKFVKVRWGGAAPTMIRKIENGEKFPVAAGETIEVESKIAKTIRAAYKEVEIIDDLKSVPAKKEMKIEGKLSIKKIAKS